MSKEFEEIVLKKLEKLDTLEEKVENVILEKLNTLDERTKNTDKVIEEVILNKLEKLDVLESDIWSLKTEIKNVNQRLEGNEKELKSTQDSIKKT